MGVFWPKMTLMGFYCTPYTFTMARQVVIARSTSVCINRQILILSAASAAGRWWQQNTVGGPVVGPLPGCILGLVIIRSEIRVRIVCIRTEASLALGNRGRGVTPARGSLCGHSNNVGDKTRYFCFTQLIQTDLQKRFLKYRYTKKSDLFVKLRFGHLAPSHPVP